MLPSVVPEGRRDSQTSVTPRTNTIGTRDSITMFGMGKGLSPANFQGVMRLPHDNRQTAYSLLVIRQLPVFPGLPSDGADEQQ